MRKIKNLNIAIVGLGNIGLNLYKHLIKNKQNIKKKTNVNLVIKYVSAKNRFKKRKANIPKKKWLKNYLYASKRPDIDIVVDDHVSTSGIAKRFKPKIPIGRVTSVQKDPEKKFSIIKLEPFENVGNMSELILIWDYTPEVKEEEEQKNDGEKIE